MRLVANWSDKTLWYANCPKMPTCLQIDSHGRKSLRIQRGFIGGPSMTAGGTLKRQHIVICKLPKMILPTCLQIDSCGPKKPSLKIQLEASLAGQCLSMAACGKLKLVIRKLPQNAVKSTCMDKKRFWGSSESVNGGWWQTEAAKRCDMQIAPKCQQIDLFWGSSESVNGGWWQTEATKHWMICKLPMWYANCPKWLCQHAFKIDSCGQKNLSGSSEAYWRANVYGGYSGTLKRQNIAICKLTKGCANMPSNRLVWTKKFWGSSAASLAGQCLSMAACGKLNRSDKTLWYPKMVVPTCLQIDSCGQRKFFEDPGMFLGGPMSVNGGLWQTQATKRCDMQIARMVAPTCLQIDSCGQKKFFEDPARLRWRTMSVNGGLWQTEATKRCDTPIATKWLCQHAFKSTCMDKKSFEDPASLSMAAGGKLKRQNIVICKLPMWYANCPQWLRQHAFKSSRVDKKVSEDPARLLWRANVCQWRLVANWSANTLWYANCPKWLRSCGQKNLWGSSEAALAGQCLSMAAGGKLKRQHIVIRKLPKMVAPTCLQIDSCGQKKFFEDPARLRWRANQRRLVANWSDKNIVPCKMQNA